MNTMKWLLRREMWEYKGMFVWAPIVVGLVMIVFMGISTTHLTTNLAGTDPSAVQHQTEMARMMAHAYMASSAPIVLMFSVIVFFYCLGALHNERVDRSILFWKSLPLSDHMTVFSKVVIALVVAPLIVLAVATVTSFVLLMFLALGLAFKGINVFGTVLGEPSLYLSPLTMIGLMPVYFLWALPTVGWLLMVSSWARSKVFLWAVGVPILGIAIIKWADFQFGTEWNVDWFIRNVIGRSLGGLFPGSWMYFEQLRPEKVLSYSQSQESAGVMHTTSFQSLDLNSILVQSWGTLAAPSVWIGAAAGAAMIFAAIRLRRSRDDG
jgi:ABC-2 type transport system permease protein